jgi:hypothetical protein
VPFPLMDDLEVECPLWNMRFPHLKKLNLLDWDSRFPPSRRQDIKDFIAYHSKILTTYGFDFGWFRTRSEVVFTVRVQSPNNQRLCLHSVSGTTATLRNLATWHMDCMKDSLKFLRLKSDPAFSRSGSQLEMFEELIADLAGQYLDAGCIFSLTSIEIEFDMEDDDFFDSLAAEDITGLIRQFRKLCGPDLTIWRGCTPPGTVIEAKELADAFSVFPILQDLTIDEYVLGEDENPEDYVLTLATRLPHLHHVVIRSIYRLDEDDPWPSIYFHIVRNGGNSIVLHVEHRIYEPDNY